MKPKTKRIMAREWLIFTGATFSGLILEAVIPGEMFIWLRWIIWFVPYIMVLLIRSIIWSVRILEKEEE